MRRQKAANRVRAESRRRQAPLIPAPDLPPTATLCPSRKGTRDPKFCSPPTVLRRWGTGGSCSAHAMGGEYGSYSAAAPAARFGVAPPPRPRAAPSRATFPPGGALRDGWSPSGIPAGAVPPSGIPGGAAAERIRCAARAASGSSSSSSNSRVDASVSRVDASVSRVDASPSRADTSRTPLATAGPEADAAAPAADVGAGAGVGAAASRVVEDAGAAVPGAALTEPASACVCVASPLRGLTGGCALGCTAKGWDSDKKPGCAAMGVYRSKGDAPAGMEEGSSGGRPSPTGRGRVPIDDAPYFVPEPPVAVWWRGGGACDVASAGSAGGRWREAGQSRKRLRRRHGDVASESDGSVGNCGTGDRAGDGGVGRGGGGRAGDDQSGARGAVVQLCCARGAYVAQG
eukprot:scaffold12393_cov105-Isochrysis_galbana.AAC.2